MRARVAALACVGVWTLAACTPTAPTATPPPVGPATATGAVPSTPGGTATSAGSPTAATDPTKLPELIVLSGTAIGGRPLGHSPAGKVEPMLVARLGKAKIGRTALCSAAEGTRAQVAVVEHVWPGLTVRYGSTGGAAVAMTWTVDLAHVPDGFRLDRGLAWQPTFATLRHMPDVTVSNTGGVQNVTLDALRITWSGPAGAIRPDTVAGGPRLECA